MTKNAISWAVFALLMTAAALLDAHPIHQSLKGGLGAGEIGAWLAFAAFLGYSIQCSRKENFFKSLGIMLRLWWGRQAGLDLYIGIALSLGVIYLHEGSALMLALWLVPMALFANLATLLYLAIHFDGLLAHFG